MKKWCSVRIVQQLRHMGLAFLMAFLLTGCGSYYTVTVDSLRDDAAAGKADSYCLMPADENISADDLLFREIVRMIKPAFMARGYKVVENSAEAKGIAYLSYWEEEPFVTMETYTTYSLKPVVLWDGEKEKVEYVNVEEPAVRTNIIHTARLHIEAFENPIKKPTGKTKKAKPLWSTMVRCSGASDDFRNLLNRMADVLPRVLGTRTTGLRTFEVFVNDNGMIEVTEQ